MLTEETRVCNKCKKIQQLPNYPGDQYSYFSGVEFERDGVSILTGRSDDIGDREFFTWEELNKTLEEINNDYRRKREVELEKIERANKEKKASNRQTRKEQYLKLKKEFENE